MGAAAGAGIDAASGGEINTCFTVDAWFPVAASDVRAGRINGSRVWCQVTSRKLTIIPVVASSIL